MIAVTAVFETFATSATTAAWHAQLRSQRHGVAVYGGHGACVGGPSPGTCGGNGAAGMNGANGAEGANGAAGATGPCGTPGTPGAVGTPGTPGAAGTAGAPDELIDEVIVTVPLLASGSKVPVSADTEIGVGGDVGMNLMLAGRRRSSSGGAGGVSRIGCSDSKNRSAVRRARACAPPRFKLRAKAAGSCRR